jgi:hypothetical protein
MSDIDWRVAQQCPNCSAAAGRPFHVQSVTSDEILVSLRCGSCAHQWTIERVTPVLIVWPKPDRRKQPQQG